MPTKARRRLEEFVALLGRGQHKPQQRFLMDALRGLHVGGNVMLSACSRALKEDQALFYTEKRLSNGLKSKRLRDDLLRDAALEITGSLVRRHRMAISVDETDISKRFARKMPYIAHVHDGDTGEIRKGWVVMRADGVAANGRHVPLHTVTFSRKAPEYRGDHDVLRSFLEATLRHVPRTAPFVFDAGHDSRAKRGLFGELGIRFTVRLVTGRHHGSRRLFAEGVETSLRGLIESTPPSFRFRIARFRKEAKGAWMATVGWRQEVTFVGTHRYPESVKYSVLVVRDHHAEAKPMVLLTTDRVQTQAQAQVVVERYFGRWAVEDGHRLLKTRFALENIRALTWRGLKRMVFLTHVAYAFMSWLVYRGDGEELARRAPAFGAVPKFPFYRISVALSVALAEVL